MTNSTNQENKEKENLCLVERIVLWENPQLTALIFLSGLLFLVSCLFLPFLQILTNIGLYLSLISLATKLYVHLMGFLKKPCQDILVQCDSIVFDVDPDLLETIVRESCQRLSSWFMMLRSLLLVHDFEQSVKFCFLLYIFSHLVCLVNTLPLLLAGWILMFTFPSVYQRHQADIQTILELARDKCTALNGTLASKLSPRKRKHTRFAPSVKDK